MAYERLSAADAAFLHIESDHEPQHVGSLSLIEAAPMRDDGGRIRIEELRAVTEARLHRVPRLRQRLKFVPFDQDAPVWVDDEHFDIEYHVRLTALPRPGDDGQLHELMGRLQSQPLDRSRPLWELWFIDGVAGDRAGLVIKTHHALGDGIANVALALALVDVEPHPSEEEPPSPWSPREMPSSARLLADGAGRMLAEPLNLARIGLSALRDPVRSFTAVADTVRTVVGFSAKPVPAPWNRDVTTHRRWSRATVPMATVRAIRKHHDATLNDVVLEACTGALREYLLDHDDPVTPLKAMVPVSRREKDEHGENLGNKVSLIVVDLPVDEEDPVHRLETIHAQTRELKGSGLADGAEHVVDLAAHAPPLAGPMARLLSRSIPMNLVITNIPGPPVPLYVRGGRVLEAYPYVEVIDGEGLTIAVISYEDNLHFGLTSDRDVMPDLDHLAAGIEKAAERMVGSEPGNEPPDDAN